MTFIVILNFRIPQARDVVEIKAEGNLLHLFERETILERQRVVLCADMRRPCTPINRTDALGDLFQVERGAFADFNPGLLKLNRGQLAQWTWIKQERLPVPHEMR